jgi:hypothetical protein
MSDFLLFICADGDDDDVKNIYLYMTLVFYSSSSYVEIYTVQ